MRRALALLMLLATPLLATRATGVSADSVSADRVSTDSGAIVRGMVHDSLTGFPLAGASVQLVGRTRIRPFGATVVTDSTGTFAFADVADGSYTIGFFHPLLDTLGVEPPARTVTVQDGRAAPLLLAVPSAATVATTLCGPMPHPERQVVLVGTVQHAATGAPLEGAAVHAEWMELVLGAGGLTRALPRRTVTTGSGGWFALCQLPAPGTVVLQAHAGADSTDRLELELPQGMVLRQPLVVGAATGGTALLAGEVRTGRDGRPLADAVVTVGGQSTRTDARGVWRLPTAPAGTRTVEVRAVGYFPVRQLVQVAEGAPEVRTTLVTFRSVLDTVKVLANYDRFSQLAEFRERARGGMGRFLTAEQVAQRVPLVASDLFTAFPGVYLERDSVGMPVLTMKGVFADRCTPAVYLNGFHLGATSLTDIDMLVKPELLLGVEVYAAGLVPPQFEPGMSGCGSLVFWTR
jgi:hypothetical protein